MKATIATFAPAKSRRSMKLRTLTERVINLISRVALPAAVLSCVATRKKSGQTIARVKSYSDICNVYHLIQATESPTASAAGFFYGRGRHIISSVPCGALMRPQPVSGGRQRGAELFLFPEVKFSIVSF